jgi:hypothetical protein
VVWGCGSGQEWGSVGVHMFIHALSRVYERGVNVRVGPEGAVH